MTALPAPTVMAGETATPDDGESSDGLALLSSALADRAEAHTAALLLAAVADAYLLADLPAAAVEEMLDGAPPDRWAPPGWAPERSARAFATLAAMIATALDSPAFRDLLDRLTAAGEIDDTERRHRRNTAEAAALADFDAAAGAGEGVPR